MAVPVEPPLSWRFSWTVLAVLHFLWPIGSLIDFVAGKGSLAEVDTSDLATNGAA